MRCKTVPLSSHCSANGPERSRSCPCKRPHHPHTPATCMPPMQSASASAALFYRIIADLARPAAGTCLLDLYAGIGTVGLTLAPRCRAVVCVDTLRENVADGRINAAAHGVGNCTFLRGAAEATIREVLQRDEATHAEDLVAVINPPRGGVQPPDARLCMHGCWNDKAGEAGSTAGSMHKHAKATNECACMCVARTTERPGAPQGPGTLHAQAATATRHTPSSRKWVSVGDVCTTVPYGSVSADFCR